MKKIVIIFIVVIFVICAFLGFKVASSILQASNPAPAVEKSIDSTIVEQKNYLLIHADTLNGDEPQLISLWMVLVYQSTSPQVMLIPLYPAYDSKVHDRITGQFDLTSDMMVSQSFLSQISKTFDIPIAGYVLVDDLAVQNLKAWLIGQPDSQVFTAAVTDEEKLTLRNSGQAAYQGFCTTISTGTLKTGYQSIQWSQLLPDHLITNIPFETFMLTVDRIIQAGSTIKCDVLSNE